MTEEMPDIVVGYYRIVCSKTEYATSDRGVVFMMIGILCFAPALLSILMSNFPLAVCFGGMGYFLFIIGAPSCGGHGINIKLIEDKSKDFITSTNVGFSKDPDKDATRIKNKIDEYKKLAESYSKEKKNDLERMEAERKRLAEEEEANRKHYTEKVYSEVIRRVKQQ